MPEMPKFLDRELSWLEFNQRVLDRALDERTPLMERLKFLAITGSNLDEFYRVRVGTLKIVLRRGITRVSLSGLNPAEQLAAVQMRAAKMFTDQYACLRELEPLLASEGLRRVTSEGLSGTQQRILRQVFEKEILSVLTPTALVGESFPHLPNELVHLLVRLRPENPREFEGMLEEDGTRYAIVPAAHILTRFFSVPTEQGFAYILVEDLVKHFISELFPGDKIEECVPFRCLRNAEVELQEFSPAGLAWEMEETLQGRSEADWVRLEVAAEASDTLVTDLTRALNLDAADVHRLDGPLDLGSFMELSGRQGFDKLKFEPWPSVIPPQVPSEELMFDILSDRDVLLYHPYDSYDPVVRFLEEAAEDADVLAIKQTLYRVSRDSRIVQALIRAVENGKHVTVLVELKARFDEARNLRQAAELERSGAHVIWGVKGYKTHAKVCIVVRREPHGIQRYVHFGTGNYNETTSRIYSDVSLLTANEDLGADAVAFFNAIAGYSHPQNYRRLEAAPIGLREALLDMIRGETQRAKARQPARILAKVNALVDPQIIEALYEASQAGVEIKLNIRGICCLRPGVPGLSENIEVLSIVDRFLEHARILYFHHGGAERMFISSADWMQRNLDQRQELLVPVDDPASRRRMMSILETCLADNVSSSRLLPDGRYERRTPGDSPSRRAQEELYQAARRALRSDQRRQRTRFEPHRPS